MLRDDELIEVAKLVFDVPGSSFGQLAYAIDKIGRVERSVRVQTAILRHWPDPTRLWPAHGNVRKLLAKEGRQ